MTTVFTLCAANYLAQAKTLGDSLVKHNPAFRFVIGLVDRIPPGMEPSSFEPYEILPVENLDIPAFWEMAEKYSLVELTTAVKSFYIEHLYRRASAVREVIYLDPDILVYGSFERLREKLRTHSLVVTPHSATYDDSPTNIYYETGMLMTGIYNLGFIATSRSETTFAFLDWWQKRVRSHSYYEPGSGVFVDQLWVTLAPLYFPGVYVEKDPGYNLCYWNHFERHLSRENGRYLVNGKHELVFSHFSRYDPTKPETATSRSKSKPTWLSERPDLKPLYDDYRDRLMDAGYASFQRLPWLLPRNPAKINPTLRDRAKDGVRRAVRAAPYRCRKLLGRTARFVIDSLK